MSVTAAQEITPIGRSRKQLAALRMFAVSITLLTVVGHAFLGFEQSFAQPIVALAVGYSMQLLLEFLYARSRGTAPAYRGGVRILIDSLLPTHIACLSIAMLLFFNERLWIVAFAVSVAVASKTVLRVPVREGSRHFLNPSNFALSMTLLLFPSVGLTMPWQWTTELSGYADWVVPVLIFVAGATLHLRFASRIWVVISFLVSFVMQALIRSVVSPEMNLLTALAPVTGVAAAIFTFYMAPDPATSPSSRWGQIFFGAGIALSYMILMHLHIVFALFYALTIVCLIRGVVMAAMTQVASQRQEGAYSSRTA